MRIGPQDLNVILAALRMASNANESLARQALEKGDRPRAMRLSAFAARCGQLSDELERAGTAPSILRPN